MFSYYCSSLAAGRHKKTHKKHKRKQQRDLPVNTSDSEDSAPAKENAMAAKSSIDVESPEPSTSQQSSQEQVTGCSLLVWGVGREFSVFRVFFLYSTDLTRSTCIGSLFILLTEPAAFS